MIIHLKKTIWQAGTCQNIGYRLPIIIIHFCHACQTNKYVLVEY